MPSIRNAYTSGMHKTILHLEEITNTLQTQIDNLSDANTTTFDITNDSYANISNDTDYSIRDFDNFQYTKAVNYANISSSTNITIISTTIDTNNNLYVLGINGHASAPVNNFDQTSSLNINSSTYNGFSICYVVKYNSSGIAQWRITMSGEGNHIIMSPQFITHDANGNIYITGKYTNDNLAFYNYNDSSTIDGLTNSGYYDAFLVKYNSSGIAQWASNICGDDNECGGISVAVDTSSNVYLTGIFNSTNLIIYNSDGETSLTNVPNGVSSGTDSFIIKYNSSGIGQWTNHFNGSGNEVHVVSIKVSSSNIYVAGYFNTSSLVIYNHNSNSTSYISTLTNTSSGKYDSVIIKYNLSGDGVWAARLGGNLDDKILSLAIDADNNIYVSGNYTSSTLYAHNSSSSEIDDTVSSSGYIGSENCFVIKYNSDGVAQWCSKLANANPNQNDELVPNSLLLDSDNNIYVLGIFENTSIIIYDSDNNSTLIPLEKVSLGSHGFIIKYSNDGFGQWIVNIGDDINNGYLSINSSDILFASVNYDNSNLSIYDSSGELNTLSNNLTNTNVYNAIIIKYDNAGQSYNLIVTDGNSESLSNITTKTISMLNNNDGNKKIRVFFDDINSNLRFYKDITHSISLFSYDGSWNVMAVN